MKNIYTLKLFSLLMMFSISVSLHAQISVLASDFAGKGDTVRFSNSNNFFNNYASSGADFVWDFSNLNPQGQTLVNHFSVDDADILTQSLFGSTVIPKYRATYFLPARELPLATLSGFLNLPIDEIYRFYRKTNAEMTVIGLSISAMGFGIGERADSIEIAYKYPMIFGQTYSSEGSVDLNLSAFAPFQLKQFRTRESEVDGWGTITTPYGTFECLRIHHIINEFDSIFLDAGTGPTWIPIPIPTIHEYEWWAKEQLGPILKVKANEIFGFELVNEVLYRDIYREELNVAVADYTQDVIRVYPNPSSNSLQIFGVNSSTKYEILTSSGQIVAGGRYTDNIDIRRLNAGVFYIRLTLEDQSQRLLRFVKQ